MKNTATILAFLISAALAVPIKRSNCGGGGGGGYIACPDFGSPYCCDGFEFLYETCVVADATPESFDDFRAICDRARVSYPAPACCTEAAGAYVCEDPAGSPDAAGHS
ncbi:hypothetical protein M426DRAFT_15781 [Hypoxylon sp. CI-4A]|nr:hypothetical protein M426DRAFT_15781 [Hypoxylon sp. CI-4A]